MYYYYTTLYSNYLYNMDLYLLWYYYIYYYILLYRLQFILVAAHHINLLQYFELTGVDKDLPRVVITDMSEPSNMRKYMFPHSLVGLIKPDSQTSTTSSRISDESTLFLQLQAFFDTYLQGSLLPTLRSDAPSTTVSTVSAKNAVNVLYGSTFQSM